MKLHAPNWAEKFYIATDASNYSIGAILYQEIGKQKRIIRMESKGLNETQQRYSIPKKELLAVVYAFYQIL